MKNSFDYRKMIYDGYSESLHNSLTCGKYEKELRLISRYFRKNYISFFPTDKNARIVDIGCGLGGYIHAMKESGYQNVIGVDTSSSVVDFLKEKGVDCVHSDAIDYLKDKENFFDVILFNDIIEHLTKEEVVEILYLFKKALVPGGCVIIKTMNMSNPVTGAAARYFDFTHEIGFNEISMRQVLTAAGFSTVKIKGADIYVFSFWISIPLKIIEKVINARWYILNCLYGRTTIKIFEKNLIALARK